MSIGRKRDFFLWECSLDAGNKMYVSFSENSSRAPSTVAVNTGVRNLATKKLEFLLASPPKIALPQNNPTFFWCKIYVDYDRWPW